MPTPAKHLLMNDEPGAAGGGDAPQAATPDTGAAPAADTSVDTAAPAAADTAKPSDHFAGLDAALDAVSGDNKPASAPAPTPAPQSAKVPVSTPAPTPAPAAGKDDDLTPPEGMSERAQARWSQLTERVKAVPELERRATEAETALTSVRKMVADSGLQANEFADMLETGRLVKSASPQDLEQALQRLDGIRADIALRLGKDVPGADPLASHPDLKAEVDGMTLTRERALEIARLRAKGSQADSLTREQQEVQQFRQTVESAAASMDAALAKLAGQPGHEAKVAFIRQQFADPAKLQQFVTTYEPHQWNAAILMMYEAYTPPVAPLPGPQPLRSTNVRPGGPVARRVVSAEGAVESAFDKLGI